MPLEEDMQNLQRHIKHIMSDASKSSCYLELRNAVCARLTLYNARRGNEPARLLLCAWKEGFNDTWLKNISLPKDLDELEKEQIKQRKVALMAGKRNALVSLLFPKDTICPLKQLIDEDFRSKYNLSPNKPYVFASSNGSDQHLSGWHCMNNFCKQLNLINASKITATKNRHWMSTIYSMMGFTDSEKKAIYDHMGHTEDMNKTRYQCPLALKKRNKKTNKRRVLFI